MVIPLTCLHYIIVIDFCQASFLLCPTAVYQHVRKTFINFMKLCICFIKLLSSWRFYYKLNLDICQAFILIFFNLLCFFYIMQKKWVGLDLKYNDWFWMIMIDFEWLYIIYNIFIYTIHKIAMITIIILYQIYIIGIITIIVFSTIRNFCFI